MRRSWISSASDEHTIPPRPSLPPLLGCALGLWVACAIVLPTSQQLSVSVCFVATVVSILFVVPCGIALWRFRSVQIWTVCLGLALGASCAFLCATTLHDDTDNSVGQRGDYRLEVVEDQRTYGYSSSVIADVQLSDQQVTRICVWLADDHELLRYGDVFEAKITLKSLSESSEPSYWNQGIVAQANVNSFEKIERGDLFGLLCGVRNRVLDGLAALDSAEVPPDGVAVLAALVCGWRGDINDSNVYQAFKASGLAHLVAVSGAHLSIVVMLLAVFLGFLPLPRFISVFLQIAFLLCYLVLAAAPPSAIRATIMAVAGMLSFTFKRRPAALNALAICILACIIENPCTALSVSFMLSSLSTLGIVVFSGLICAWIERVPLKLPGMVSHALALTLASSLLTLPVTAALFAQIPLIAPLANIVVAPLFPLVCTFGLIAAVFAVLFPGVAPFVLGSAAMGAQLLVIPVRVLSSIPYASIPAYGNVTLALAFSGAAAFALWRWWPSPNRQVLFAMLSVVLSILVSIVVILPRFSADELVMLDVGQGDAFLLQSDGACVLIDTGNREIALREALARCGVVRLDAVIISHADDDHMGSLTSLKNVVQVDKVLLAHDALSCSCKSCIGLYEDACFLVGEDNVEGMNKGDTIQVGIFNLEVVWPETFTDEGENADSLSLVASADVNRDDEVDWTALFVGDAERDQLAQMVENGDVGCVDIYKVGHHGSKNAIDEELAEILAPKVALVSVGAHNRYGHPTQETLSVLADQGAAILRSDEVGDVAIKFQTDTLRVDTLR